MAQLTAITQQDLSRGQNSVTNPYLIGQQQSLAIINQILDEHGSARTRDGTRIITQSPDIAPNILPIVKLYDYIRQDGMIFPLAIVQSSVGLPPPPPPPQTPTGQIGAASLHFSGSGYSPFDTGIIQGGNGDATYRVDQVDFLLGVVTFTITNPGTGYVVATNVATTPTSGGGSAFTLDINSVVSNPPQPPPVPATGNNRLYNRGTVPWTLIGQLGTGFNIPDILTFTNLALIVNGYETPWSYDGTTLQHLVDGSGTGSVPQGGKHHALHQGFYWLWNTAATSSQYDGPSSLRSSDLNNPNSWPKANQIFVDKDDGDQGQGMGQFTIAETGISPTTSMILFKSFTAYQMTGVFGSTNPAFAIQKIKSDMGCVSPRTIQFAPGFGLIRLTHRGFALFDGVDDKLISEEVRPLIFGSEVYTPLDWPQIDQAYATVVQNPPLYIAFTPVTGSGLTRCFCYDLVRRGWSMIEYPNSISTVQTIEDPGTLPLILTGDFNEGKVRRIFSGDRDDDGTPIQWQLAPRPVSSPSPQANGYYRRLVIKLADVVEGQTIDVTVLFGPVTSNPPRQITRTLRVPTTVGLGLGFGLPPFGSSAFGGVQYNSEVDLTMDLGLIGTNARAVLTGEGFQRTRGLEWHVKAKPLRRVSMYG